MHLDSEDLLAQIRRDWPTEYELSHLRKLAELQDQEIQRRDREIERLNGLLPATTTTYSASSPRPYVLPMEADEAHHG